MTPLYEMEDLLYGAEGWNGILHSNLQKIEASLFTRYINTLGEDVSVYDAVYLKSDGKLWLAQADGTKQPCIGLMIEDGLTDEAKRIQTRGLITNVAWAWTPGSENPVYLSSTVAGELTQTPTGGSEQILGFPTSATQIFLTAIHMSSLAGTQPYLVRGMFDGLPTASQVIHREPLSINVTFPTDLADCYLRAETGATNDTIFSLQNDTVEFATATFSSGGGTEAVFVLASDEDMVIGDNFTIVAPATPDAALADLSWSIKGIR